MDFDLTNIKGFIFDVDGTILDSMIIWKDLCSKYLQSIGVIPETGLDKIVCSMSMKEGGKYLKEHYQLNLSLEEIKKGIDNLIAHFYLNEVRVKNGVLDFIKKLDSLKIPMSIATSCDLDLVKHSLKNKNLLEYFKGVLTCNELDTNKNEAKIFLESVKLLTGKMETEINDFVVIEDSLTAIKTARKAGFKTIAVEDESSKKEKDELIMTADFYVKDLSELNLIG